MKLGRNRTILISICLIVTIAVAYFILALTHGYITVDVAGPVEVGPEWVEVRSPKPLKISRRTQYLALYVSDSHEAYNEPQDRTGKTFAMRYPDGSLVRPEVRLVDESGKEYDLDSAGFLGKTRSSGDLDGGMSFSRSFESSLDSDFANGTYPVVKLRSNRPIHISRIEWNCYNPK